MSILARTAKLALLCIGVISALGTLGVDVTAMVTGLGLTGFAVGFALKDIISNSLAGILILIYKPFQRHDRIMVTFCADGFGGARVARRSALYDARATRPTDSDSEREPIHESNYGVPPRGRRKFRARRPARSPAARRFRRHCARRREIAANDSCGGASRIADYFFNSIGNSSILAARMKSFSDSPPIAWVQSSIHTRR